jgi:hypothetical protein
MVVVAGDVEGRDAVVWVSVRVQIYTAQDFPALCQPYASLHTASTQIAARPRQSEEHQFSMHEVCTL